jgi:poly(3-hydroxybutyrate) depolymerase
MLLWRALLSTLVFSVAAIAGATAWRSPAHAASGRVTFDVNGVERAALIVEKSRLRRKTRPVIILLQDAERNAPIYRRALRFERFSENGGIFVHAEPLQGVWSFGSPEGTAREIAYLQRLVETVTASALADRSRVYLVGVGAGGAAALQAVCNGGERYAGVAAVRRALFLRCLSPAAPTSACLWRAGMANCPDIPVRWRRSRPSRSLLRKQPRVGRAVRARTCRIATKPMAPA